MIRISIQKDKLILISFVLLTICCFCFYFHQKVQSLFSTNLSVLSILKGNSTKALEQSIFAKNFGFINSGQYYNHFLLQHRSEDLKKAFLHNQSNVNYIFLFADESILTGDWISSSQHFNNIPFSRYLARRGMEIAYSADPEQAKKGLYYLSFARKILSEPQISSFLGSVLCFKYRSHQKGESLLWDAIKENPKNTSFLDSLAQVNQSKGRNELYRSFKELNRRLTQTNSNILLEIGGSLVQENRLDEGIQYFLLAKRNDPKNLSVRYKLAKTYEKQGNLLLAEGEYREAIEQNPSESGPRFEWGVNLYQNGDYPRALIQFTIATTLKIDDLWSYYYRALCYEKLKNYNKAKQDFEKCLSLEPSNQTFKNKLLEITKEN